MPDIGSRKMKLILSLGSNIGDKENNIRRAVALINDKVGSVVKMSSLYRSEPVGFVSDNRFVNVVVEVCTKLPVYRVLKVTQKIEKALGRTQKSKNEVYRDKIIDIDIIFYSNYSTRSSKLTVPHPHFREREFVMMPLLEINPQYKH